MWGSGFGYYGYWGVEHGSVAGAGKSGSGAGAGAGNRAVKIKGMHSSAPSVTFSLEYNQLKNKLFLLGICHTSFFMCPVCSVPCCNELPK